MNERNSSTAPHGDRSFLCRLTLSVSFRFAAAISLIGRRRLKRAWVSLGGTSGVSMVVEKRYGLRWDPGEYRRVTIRGI